MLYFYFLDINNYYPNITIISILTSLIAFLCVYFPYFHFWKSLDRHQLKNLIPFLLKSYVSSIFLGSFMAIFCDFLQGFFFTDIDILEKYITYLILLTVLYIWFYIKITYYPEWDCRIICKDLEEISNEEIDKRQENYINNLRQQQIAKKRQQWLTLKKIIIYSFCIFCFAYLSLALIVAYIMFG